MGKKTTPEDEKAKFSARLNMALDESPLGIPAKGEGRQVVVAKMFSVGQKAARKWMEGEGFPEMEKCIIIARKLNVSIEWLLTGRGKRHMIDDANAGLTKLLALWFRMSEPLQNEVIDYSAYLIEKSQPAQSPAGKVDTADISHKKTH